TARLSQGSAPSLERPQTPVMATPPPGQPRPPIPSAVVLPGPRGGVPASPFASTVAVMPAVVPPPPPPRPPMPIQRPPTPAAWNPVRAVEELSALVVHPQAAHTPPARQTPVPAPHGTQHTTQSHYTSQPPRPPVFTQ